MSDWPESTPKRLGQSARLFWAFVEPFLSSAPDQDKQRARIPRDVLSIVWQWIGAEILPHHFGKLEGEVQRAAIEGSVTDIANGITRMKRLVAPVLEQTLLTCRQNPGAMEKLTRHLGNENIIAHLRDMGDALTIEPVLARLQMAFPVPVSEPDYGQIEDMLELIEAGAAKAPHCVDMIYVGAIPRFANPTLALRLATHRLSSRSAEAIEASDYSILIDVIVFDLVATGRSAIETYNATGWNGALIERVDSYCQFAAGLHEEIQVTEFSKIGRALSDMKAQFVKGLAPDIEAIPDRVVQLFAPLASKVLESGPNQSDIYSVSAQLQACISLGDYAADIGLDDAISGARHAASSYLEEASSTIIEAIRSKSGEERDHAMAYLDVAVDFTQKLQGREVARIVRRLGQSAATVNAISATSAVA